MPRSSPWWLVELFAETDSGDPTRMVTGVATGLGVLTATALALAVFLALGTFEARVLGDEAGKG